MTATAEALPLKRGTLPGEPASSAGRAAVRSLYVHIPFCEHKCGYCDFASVAGLHGQHEYAEALLAELRLLAQAFPEVVLDTVFFGGGTPGLLDPALLHSLMAELRSGFRLASNAEVTIEANPSSTSERRAGAWLAAGFNRVSLGIQSLEPEVLRFLDRVHDAGRALAAMGEVRAAGFEAVNCDLIYAVPGLDDDRWGYTIDRVMAFDPGHISCYELTVERGTALQVAVAAGRSPAVDEAAAIRQHAIALDRLEPAGYQQYEVSNFARPGRECRHNLAYWRNRHYLAAGVGAHGHVPAATAASLGLRPAPAATSVRYWHPRSLPAYCRLSRGGVLPLTGYESIGAAGEAAERLMLGLRLNEGTAHTRTDEVNRLVAAGLVTAAAGLIRTTRRGQVVLNELVARLCL